jgi:hypothetical protein
VNGGNGDDVVVGSAGNDVLNGDANDDFLLGLDGAATFNCGANTDFADGGAGIDSQSNCETSPTSRSVGGAAAGVGFEPTEPVARLGGFQDRPFRPLGHPAGASLAGAALETRRARR